MIEHRPPALIAAAKALAEKHGVYHEWECLLSFRNALLEALSTTPPSEEAPDEREAPISVSRMATAVGRDCVSNCGGDEVTTPKPEPSCPPHHWSHSPTVGCYTCLKCRTAVYAHLDHGRYTEIEAEVAATVAAIAPKPEPTEDHLLARAAQIADLRHLLTFPKLGEWGMETLIDTLNQLIPELAENPVSHGTFHD